MGRKRSRGNRENMKIKMEDGYIYIIEANITQTEILKSWTQLKWDKKMRWWKGAVNLELLDKLSSTFQMPPSIKAEHDRLNAIQDAVDAERIKAAEDIKPLVKYPVKKKLYTHQVRAANMTLMVFGLVEPKKGKST